MKKQITQEQINIVLQTLYATNISAANFDAVKKFFIDVPEIKEEVKKEAGTKIPDDFLPKK